MPGTNEMPGSAEEVEATVDQLMSAESAADTIPFPVEVTEQQASITDMMSNIDATAFEDVEIAA